MRTAFLFMAALLSGCATFGAEDTPEPAAEAAPNEKVTERIRHVFLPRQCGRIKKAWLRHQATEKKSEGVVAEALEVAEARGKQVDTLNSNVDAGNANLTRIESVLKRYGCGVLDQ